MENASKALYMAGGILISIIVATIAVVLFRNGSLLTSEYDIKLSRQELQAYNAEFEKYANKDYLLANDIVSLINKAYDVNKKEVERNEETITIKIKFPTDARNDQGRTYIYDENMVALDDTEQERQKEQERRSNLGYYGNKNNPQFARTIISFLQDYSNTKVTNNKVEYMDKFKCDKVEYHNSGKIKSLNIIYQ